MYKKALFLFLLLLPTKSLGNIGLDALAQKMCNSMEAPKTQKEKRKEICSPGGICRGWGGLACSNHHIFSMCWLICKDEEGFRLSPCMQVAAKYLKFDHEKSAFISGRLPILPEEHLQQAIYNPRKNILDHILLCRNICSAVRTDIKKSLKQRLMSPLSARPIEGACKVSCR